MHLLKLILKVLLLVPVALVAGLLVYMVIVLIGLKFESHEYPVIAMLIGGPAALLTAATFFLWSVNRLYEKHTQRRSPADMG